MNHPDDDPRARDFDFHGYDMTKTMEPDPYAGCTYRCPGCGVPLQEYTVRCRRCERGDG